MDESEIPQSAATKTAELLELPLLNQGFAILKDLVPDSWLEELHGKFQSQSTEFKKAMMGKPGQTLANENIRGDATFWLDPQEPLAVLQFLHALQKELNQRFFWGLNSFECHLASYAPGKGYDTHVDNPLHFGKKQNPRVLTFLAYFNKNWQLSHGGQLEIFSSTSAQDGNFARQVLVEPQWNQWVFFLSEKFPHRVLPGTQDRESLSGWFRHDPFPS